ncbi:MAG: hypothetical protein GX126_12530 [Bacteroidales bacterium]|nr:hypothetical protein [Bacteroidales bacterium]
MGKIVICSLFGGGFNLVQLFGFFPLFVALSGTSMTAKFGYSGLSGKFFSALLTYFGYFNFAAHCISMYLYVP